MNTEQVLKVAKAKLVSVNERFGWQGDEEDQAWDLLVHAWGREPDDEDVVPPDVRRHFDRLIERRRTGEPVAFLVGWVDFFDFRLNLSPGVFVPRLTSEFLATQAIRRLRRRSRPIHVDLATGIGPVAIASARANPRARVWGLDISRKAVNVATVNAAKLGVRNATFLRSDMFKALPRALRGKVDVVSIHPPYVPRGEVGDLPVEIKRFEPKHTLTDRSSDGLGLVRRVVDEALDWLRPGGWLLIEITANEFRSIRSLMSQAGYRDIRSTHGKLKLTRVIVGRV